MCRTHRPVLVLLVATYLAACSAEAPGPVDPPTPTNQAPIARAGSAQSVSATLPVALDGSASSDADGDPLTYQWAFTATPAGSQATLEDPTAAQTGFTPDLPGTYTASLVVSDGEATSSASEVTITAADNTATMTIGSAGAVLESSDGITRLDVPAGALNADTEISITSVPANQRPEEFADLPTDALVYDFKPDGLVFDEPVELSMELESAPSPGTSDIDVSVWMIGGLSNETASVPSAQAMTVSGETGTASVSAEISHFSSWVAQRLVIADGNEGLSLETQARVPLAVVSFLPFEVEVTVADPRATPDPEFMAALPAQFTDKSPSPLEVTEPSNQLFVPDAFNPSWIRVINEYTCTQPGTASWSGTVELDLSDSEVLFAGGSVPFGTATVALQAQLQCSALPSEFLSFDIPSPEGMRMWQNGGSTAILWTAQGGVWMGDRNGEVTARFLAGGANQFTPMFEAAAISTAGVLVGSASGILVGQADLTTASGDFDLSTMIDHDGGITDQVGPVAPPTTDGPSRAVPDVTAHVTDVFPAPDGNGGEQIVTVLFGDQNISFFEPRDGEVGFRGRTDLAEAFKTDQGSVFGTELPVTAWVGPDGFTETAPMLVVTVTDDAQRSSTLWLAELVAGQAVLTEVDNIFPAEEARRLRCLDGICVLGSYGGPVSFGNVVFFTWDGQDGIEPIQGLSQRTIGVDLVDSGNGSVYVATTSFDSDAYTVFEIAKDGTFLDSWFSPAPDGCTGPGHVLFRSPEEVILSCNTSGTVVSSRPFDGE